MAEDEVQGQSARRAPSWLGTARLLSGLALVAFAASHLLNHALGLWSLELMEAGRRVFVLVWRNPVTWGLAPAALTIHVALAVWSMLRRRTLRMSRADAAQALLGHTVPLLLLGHLVQTRWMHTVRGVDDTYTFILSGGPFGLIYLSTLLTVAWSHGAIGLHGWLRLRPWYPRAAPLLWAITVALPLAAAGGVWRAAAEVRQAAQDPGRVARAEALQPLSRVAYEGEVRRLTILALLAVLGPIGLLYVARAGSTLWWLSRRRVVIRYDSGVVAEVPPGTTVLEASRIAGVPHASVCGGRGRCSTCRVRVYYGREHLPPPAPSEQRVLDKIGAGEHVRLACQLRPEAMLYVAPILAAARPEDGFRGAGHDEGREVEAVILFADLRGFTQVAERKLPYDVVHILNQYFDQMGAAIEAHHGYLDKFIGDGLMAVFGVDGRAETAARDALAAAEDMGRRLDRLNAFLETELDAPLRMGIGVYGGPVIMGRLGYRTARQLTAIGDAVNTASRLESLTKELDCQLLVAEDVARQAGVGGEVREVTVRGRAQPVRVMLIPRAGALGLTPAPALAPPPTWS